MSRYAVTSMLRPAAATALWLVWTFLLLPLQAVAVWLRLPLAGWLPRVYHRGVCRLFGLDVAQSGTICSARPTLFVANHCSYFDIAVLGSLLPASFIATGEIRDWPLLGWLARLQRSVFVDREIARTREHHDRITERLEAGDSLILFPESTTGDGNRLLDFRSSFFAVAERPIDGRSLVVQPITVAYVRQRGVPIGHAGRPRFAWYGDMSLGRHFWQAIGSGRITVAVAFHEPIEADRFASRKLLARHCFEQIGFGLQEALYGTQPGCA